jgi:CheY-like chemotaxis protein
VADPKQSTVSMLVAESLDSARSSLADLLRYEGYRVFEAGNHRSAVTSIEENPDLRVLLVDLYLPEFPSIIQHAQLKLSQPFVIGMGNDDFTPLPWIPATPYLRLLKPLEFNDVRTAIRNHVVGIRKP